MQDEMKTQIKKIVVKPEDELTDLLSIMKNVQEGRIILTFTEPNDLLISPINLKVIQEEADNQEQAIIAQIINNPSGVRNAQEAGYAITTNSGEIEDNLWERAEENAQRRVKSREENLKRALNTSAPSARKEQPIPAEPTEQAVVNDYNFEQAEQVDSIQSQPATTEKSDFTKRVESAINKSREAIERGDVKTVRSGSVEIALDQDINELKVPEMQLEQTEILDQTTNQFNRAMKPDGKTADTNPEGGRIPIINTLSELPNKLKKSNFSAKAKVFFNKLTKGKSTGKLALIIGAPALVITILVLWILYKTSPLVHVELSISSTPVAVETEFTGDPSTTTFSIEDKAIRVKKETVEKSLSDNASATGVAQRGDKATGLVAIQCIKITGSETIPAGTTLTANTSSLNYVTVNDATVSCTGETTVTVQAAAVGDDYNLPSGELFTVGGYSQSEVRGINSTSDISGGKSESYTVISQKDVDALTKTLQETGEADAEATLGDAETDGWVMIQSTLSHDIDGDVETDSPVGTEVEIFNLSLTLKSSAIYYNKKDLEDNLDEMLITAAEEEDLFADSEGLELTLNDEIVSEIAVKSTKDNKVTVQITASGAVVPDIDKDKIEGDLRGKSWTDGLDYLDGLNFLVADPVLRFTPEWIPEGMWYFPTRQGRTILKINLVDSTDTVEES